MLAELPGLVEERIASELVWASLEGALLNALRPLLFVLDEEEREEQYESVRHYGYYTAQRSLAYLGAASQGAKGLSARMQGELRAEWVGIMEGEQHEDMAHMRVRELLERHLGAAVAASVLPWNNKLPQPQALRASIEAKTGTSVEAAVSGRRQRRGKLEELLRVMGYYPRTMSEEARKYIDGAYTKTRVTLGSVADATTAEWEERYGEDWRERVYKSSLTCRQALRSRRVGWATLAQCVFCGEVGRMNEACEGRWLRRGDYCREHGDEVVCLGEHGCCEGSFDPTKHPIEFRCGCAFVGHERVGIE